MIILQKALAICEECGERRGHIIEQYNGLVPVYCYCDRSDKEKRLANPCAIFCEGGTAGPRVIWKPISDYRNEVGEWMHVPSFDGPSMRQTAPGWKPRKK